MKYPAIIKKEKDGKYSVSFPDFKGSRFGLCVSCGDTLQEAKKNAEEALRLHVLGLIEDGEKLPTPSYTFDVYLSITRYDKTLKEEIAITEQKIKQYFKQYFARNN